MAEKGSSFLLKKAPAGTTVTFTNSSNICTYTSHGMSAGDAIVFDAGVGTLPAAITAGQLYYAGDISIHTFTLHNTYTQGVAGTSDVALADDGSGTLTGKIMTTVAGMRTTAFTINANEVDITTKDSTSQWRELLAAAGDVSMSISASGVFQDDVGLAAMRVSSISRILETYIIVFESNDAYWGTFQVTSCEHAGEYNGEVTYSVTLESSGAVTQITDA